MPTLVKFILFSVFSMMSSLAYTADLKAGKAKANTCVSCHGVSGISTNDNWPNLAGQNKGYLIKQLKDFKTGARKDAQMGYWAKTLSKEDIDNIAAYYNSLKP